MPKRLYTGFSFINLLWSLVIRVALVIAIILTYPHYNDNPPVIAVVLFLCGLFILVLGNDEIIVYEDRVIETDFSFWKLIFRNRNKTVFFTELKRAYTEEKPKPTLTEATVAIAALAIFKTRHPDKYKLNTIFFELNDGSTTKWLTDLDSTVVSEITETINSALQRNIKK